MLLGGGQPAESTSVAQNNGGGSTTASSDSTGGGYRRTDTSSIVFLPVGVVFMHGNLSRTLREIASWTRWCSMHGGFFQQFYVHVRNTTISDQLTVLNL